MNAVTNEDKKTRETVFTRSYTPTGSEVRLGDEVMAVLDIARVDPAAKDKAATRHFTDGIVSVGMAAHKADGATLENVREKMQATVQSAYDAEWKFRNASGDGGLSLAEEQEVVCETLVTMGLVDTLETAKSKVAALYAITKINKKGYVTRPDYNSLKNVPEIKAALAKAQPTEDTSAADLLKKVA